MNITILKGRLVRDVDLRTTSTGTTVAKFTLAVDRPKRKDQEKSDADFISCVAFDKRAEVIERNCHKGDALLVKGSIRTGSYDKNGQKVYTTDLWIDEFYFCGGSKQSAPKPSSSFDEDIPF